MHQLQSLKLNADHQSKRILCLMGPTGSGKSAIALTLAAELNGCIINADSRQVYADFPCITAQPSKAVQSTCPHDLYGFLPSQEAMTAGIWLNHAQKAIKSAYANNTIPILVGGTGLYFRALLDGLTAIPPITISIKKDLQKRMHTLGPKVLHEELGQHDPTYAARIHHNDTQRILRALEVYLSTGQNFSWWHNQAPTVLPYEALCIGVGFPLQDLTPFLAQRIDRMLEGGALEEAAKAYEQCPDTDAPGWSGIGCRETLSIQQGVLSEAEAKEQWLTKTRAYAKRQWTWFKADKRITWFTPYENNNIQNHILTMWSK